MLFHNTLDVLATDTNDSLVILIRDVEGDRSRHFLLYQAHSLLHRVIRRRNNINIEVVFPEAVEYDLDIAYIVLVEPMVRQFLKKTYSAS